MGRKVHPKGFRLKVNKTWDGRWYAEGQEYVDQLRQDIELRDMIREETQRAGVSRIEIERFPNQIQISIQPAVLETVVEDHHVRTLHDCPGRRCHPIRIRPAPPMPRSTAPSIKTC